jgi:hypothetical protein
MPPETWLVLTIAAAFLLLGIAGSPLAWIMLHHRRSRSEQLMELRWRTLTDHVRALDDRLTQHESIKPVDSAARGVRRADLRGARGPVPVDAPVGRGSVYADSGHKPALIAVPNLEGAPSDRDATVNGLKERYAAIWALADTGATPEVIARAAGQPIGQIELILGLRRQIDGESRPRVRECGAPTQ